MPQPSPDVRPSADGAGSPLDAIVIGAGFAGMYMVHRLRELGFTVHGFEAGDGVGGTWYWNRYPGARCDSESMYYSYSFLPDAGAGVAAGGALPGPAGDPAVPEPRRRPAATCASTSPSAPGSSAVDLRRPDANLWTVRTEDGDAGARPGTSSPRWAACRPPTSREFPGADSVRRAVSCTPATGRTSRSTSPASGSGSIGTGASGIQAIPVIAEQAGHLTVFQRTAQFTIPAANGPLDPEFAALWKQNYPEWRRRGTALARRLPLPGERDLGAGADRPAERTAAFEARLGAGRVRRSPGHLRRHADQRGSQRDGGRLRPGQDRRDRARPGGRRDAQAPGRSRSGPSGCRWTPTTTRPSTGPTSPWSTCSATPIEEITATGHQDHARAPTTWTSSSTPPGSTR